MAKIRSKTRDVAYQFRMGAGRPGDVNRSHPVSIEPAQISVNAPPTAYGQAVLVDTSINSVRPFTTGDTSTAPYGVTVSPFPYQQTTGGMSASFGSGTPPTSGVIDIARAGYVMTSVPAGQSPTKNGAVYIWVAASSGAHVQGGFETAANGGNTVGPLTNCTFNGPADASGNVELAFNI